MDRMLEKDFYRRDGLVVARELLGKVLVRKVNGNIYKYKIVETEAYRGPEDKGCHAYNNKRTERTKPIFEEGGITYVYLIYGMYSCLNIVAERKGIPHAVLIRGVEPVNEESINFAKQNRPIKSKKLEDLTNGPGKLCKALKIDKALNAVSLLARDEIWITEGEEVGTVISCPRINIAYAEEYVDVPWRFYIEDNPFVSIKVKG